MNLNLKFVLLIIFCCIYTLSFSQNKSFTFDGASYINIGTNVATDARTIELWFNLEKDIDSSLSSFKVPLQRNKSASNAREFAFAFNRSSVQNPGHFRFKLNEINGIKHEVISDTNKWTAGIWHHAAAVIDSIDGLLLFIDGQLQKSRDTTWKDPLPSSTDVIMIGCNGSLLQYFFEGELDEVRFSSNARYTSNFRPNCKFSDDSLTQGLYNFDTIPFAIVAVDSSVNQYNGSVINAAISNTNSCSTPCQPLIDSLSIVSCDNFYTSPSGKYTWTQSGIYQDTQQVRIGCDSIFVIDLIIDSATTSFVYDTACGSYLSPSGKTFISGGLYYDTIPNVNACDSLMTIFLTLNNSTSSSLNAISCGSYTSPSNKVYSASGNYSDTLQNSIGCDSIISISLTIDTLTNGVTRTGNNLISNQNSVNYQWLDCNNGFAQLVNDTNQSFSTFFSGSYAVEVSNTCIDTSSCFLITIVGLEEPGNSNNIELYPNPSNGNVWLSNIENVKQIKVYSYSGQLILDINSPKKYIDLRGLADGVYYLNVIGDNLFFEEKVIINRN